MMHYLAISAVAIFLFINTCYAQVVGGGVPSVFPLGTTFAGSGTGSMVTGGLGGNFAAWSFNGGSPVTASNYNLAAGFANSDFYINALTGGSIKFSVNNVTVASISSTGFTSLVTPPIVKVSHQTFTATGTYTPSAGILYAIAECVGGGGGGGGAVGGATVMTAGGGGGAGSYSKVRLTSAQIGASQAVTIPAAAAGGPTGNNNGAAGGDVSLGSLCIGKGGGNGFAGNNAGGGGAGGVAGTGDLTTTGQPGETGISATIITITGRTPLGGSTLWGGPPAATVTSASAVNGASASATAYGAGGNGGATDGTATTAAGGSGAKGYVMVTEFTSQ